MTSEHERAASALRHINATCTHDEWVRIGMAAKSAGLEFEDFHSWSATGDNYSSEKECLSTWKSFSDSGPVTEATLFALAYAQDWKDPAKGANPGANSLVGAKPARIAPKPAIRNGNSKAESVWELCEPATSAHPYIAKKGGLPGGLRIYPHSAPPLDIRGKNVAGWLVVPCWSDGKLQTLQFVPEIGDKLNLPSAQFNDGFFALGDISVGGLVYIGEGIGQAWACHGASDAAAVVTFGAGRMKVVAASLRAKDPTARLVLVPDRGKESQAQAIAAAVNCEWCELLADKPDNYDANDYALEFGSDALAIMLKCTKVPAMRFKLLSAADLFDAPPLRWMVRGVLPREGLAALYGPSGSGKSFLVLDVAASVAGGEYDWFGRRVTQCPVTYCALEGEAGMGKRVKAWSRHNKKPVPDGLHFITQPFNLLEAADVADLAKAVQAGNAGGLVILDTLNRSAPGADENSSVDMGNIIAGAKQLQTLVGGLVLLVHHTGKDAERGLRGHSSLYAALDGAIEVKKTTTRREWNVAKSKDDETGAVHAFKLDVVEVGIDDDDGEAITSCAVVPDESVAAAKRVKLPSSGHQKIALEVLAEPLRNSKEFGKDGVPPGHPCVRYDEAVRIVAERLPCEARRCNERAKQSLTALVAKGIYGFKGDWLWRN